MPYSPLLHSFSRIREDDFITIKSGAGAAVFDDKGNRYVDALASLWYCNIGHGRKEVVEAVAWQMEELEVFHTFDRFTNAPADTLAKRLVKLAPMQDCRVFLTSGGSEAVDSALKIARYAHALAGDKDRTIVISRAPSYHGATFGGTSCTGLPPNQEYFGPLLPDVIQVPHQDTQSLEEAFAQYGSRIAATITEPVTGGGGVQLPPAGYLERMRELCSEHGAFFIMDEVICGFGRLGDWWGSKRYGIQPDLVTFAKAVTSGYQPLGGVLIGPAVRERLESTDTWFRHGYTYSGHPTSCAAAHAVLDITEREGLVERATHVGARLSEGLKAIEAEGLLREVRGDGAVWGVELEHGVDARAVWDQMLAGGVLARPIGDHVIAFCPPLVIETEDIDLCCGALHEAIRAVRSRSAVAV